MGKQNKERKKKKKNYRDHHHRHRHHQQNRSGSSLLPGIPFTNFINHASMPINRKRSLSPNTESSFTKDGSDEQKRSTLSSYFSKFKQSFLSPSPTAETKDNDSQPNESPAEVNIDHDSLTNFTPSDKRRRLSIQGHPSPQQIPRSSVAYSAQFLPRQRSYLIIYNGVKTNEEELNNDLEVRVTAKELQSSTNDRDDSPLLDLPPAPNSDIILGGGEIDEKVAVEEEKDDNGNVAEFQEVIEYAPLYQDESGNIVRPPFINLDPRERYQLLQLKRSIETSEALQSRIKYMVNPNETQSRKIKGTNKVETSTQTHDIDYLNTKLSFKRKSGPHSLIQQRPLKKQKRRGFAMPVLEYDITPKEPVVSISSLNGVLGEVSKPKFKDLTIVEDKKITRIIPREDEEPISKKFAKPSGTGNRDLFGREDTSTLKLDDNYIKQTDSISDIIKLKDNLEETNKTKKVSVGPSSGFKFNIKKDDFKEVLDAIKENDKMLENTKSTKSGLFEEKKPEEKTSLFSNDSKPLFLFGGSKKPEQPSLFTKSDNDSKEPPKISFGGQPAQTKEAPKFSFGKTATPEEPKLLLNNNKEKSEEPKTSSLFSFGSTEEKKTTDAPKQVLFGDKKDSESEKPLFSFGGPKKDAGTAPTFSFGGKKESTPASLDDKKDTPSISFSLTANKKEEEKPKLDEAKPLFSSSGATSKDSTPSIPNTASPTPFSFGVQAKDDKKDEQPKSGLFSLPQSKTDTATLAGSTFKFGTSNDKSQKRQLDDDNAKTETEKKDKNENQQSVTKKVDFETPASTTPQPILFSFGSATSSNSKPAFNLGANTTEKNTSTPSTPSVATSTPAPAPGSGSGPGSTLTNNATNAPNVGAFSFNTASKPTPPPVGNPNFKFAAGITPPSGAKPLFNFSVPASSSTPTFGGFGQTPAFGGSATGASPAFGQSNNTGGAFGQSNNAGGAFGQSAPPSVFGQSSSSNNNTFGQSSNMFGSKLATNITTGPANTAFGSRPATPTFNFGGATNPAGSTNPAMPAPLPSGVPLFNFTGSKESTPDPATIFGQHNANRSASSTPFGNTMNNNMFGQQAQPQTQPQQQPNMFGATSNPANNSFTFGGANGAPTINGGVPTPVVNPRRIIQPRSRRR